jgi:hypothetical protein
MTCNIVHSQFYSVVWNDIQECLGHCIPKWLSTSLVINFSLHFFEPLLAAGVESLRSFLSRMVLNCCPLSIPFNSSSFKIFCIPSSGVCQGVPFGLFPSVVACETLLGCESSPILIMCPNYLNYANSVITLRGIFFHTPFLFFDPRSCLSVFPLYCS